VPLDPAVGVAAEYNSACVNTLRRSLDGCKHPDHHGNFAVMILSVISTDGGTVERLYPIDPIDAYVGERLRLVRLMRGLTQTYLGSCVGVSFQQLQKYETGANRISASKLAWFARTLGVPVNYFYQGLPTEYHNGGPPIAPPDELPVDKDVLLRPETHKLIRLYYALRGNQERKAVLVFLHTLIKA
jgi:transcriptional regulator with XRE-family HTH domain